MFTGNYNSKNFNIYWQMWNPGLGIIIIFQNLIIQFINLIKITSHQWTNVHINIKNSAFFGDTTILYLTSISFFWMVWRKACLPLKMSINIKKSLLIYFKITVYIIMFVRWFICKSICNASVYSCVCWIFHLAEWGSLCVK